MFSGAFSITSVLIERYLLMGRKPRHRPEQLGPKLLQIRNAFGLSQSEMLKRLEAEDDLSNARLSEYESGTREPPLWILLAYARAARVPVDDLIDDKIDLPNKLPSTFLRRGSERKDRTAQK